MSVRYLLGAIVSIPLIPIIYVQGKLIKKRIPDLPEAEGPTGYEKGNGSEEISVLMIGESTVAGVGVKTHQEGFPGTFAKNLSNQKGFSVDWLVHGKSGYTMKQVRKELLPESPEKQFDLIIVGTGGNDTFKLNNPISWKREIRLFIEDCKKKYPDTPIAFNCMPPVKEFAAFTRPLKFVMGNLIEILGEELGHVADEYDGVFYNHKIIKLRDWSANGKYNNTDFFSDGVHPSQLTYQLLGEDMASFIERENILKLN